MDDSPRVAIVHYWLVGMRGGEKVLEALCRMFPQADIYTHVAIPERLSTTLLNHRIIESRVAALPFARRYYKSYLPLMPLALEEFDLSGYDLIISSEAGPAKGIIPPPGVPHLCYCHSPMRYIWDQYHTYHDDMGLLAKLILPKVAHRLRQWDVTSSARADLIVANSNHVAARVKSYWRRKARVVHPPVAVDGFRPVAPSERGGFYLWAGELAPYKRPDLAIEAFQQLDRPLVVIGGPEKCWQKLVKTSGPKTVFLGRVHDTVLKSYMARCRALVFPGEEDFGIVPVEVMASGRPVIAYGKGGALDTVIDRETGLLFHDQSVEGLVDAVIQFERSGLEQHCHEACTSQAKQFSEQRFRSGILDCLAELDPTLVQAMRFESS